MTLLHVVTEADLQTFEDARIYFTMDGSQRLKPWEHLFFEEDCTLEPYSVIPNGYRLWPMGAFSYCHSALDTEVRVGRYCSIAGGVTVIGHNHVLDAFSTSSFVENSNAKLFDAARVDAGIPPLPPVFATEARALRAKGTVIEHDVWIGQHAMLARGITIGTGSVVAAGAVVTKSVPPYAIVGGNPAKLIRYRFPEELIERLLASCWWRYSYTDFVDLDYSKPEAFLDELAARGERLTPLPDAFPPLVQLLAPKLEETQPLPPSPPSIKLKEATVASVPETLADALETHNRDARRAALSRPTPASRRGATDSLRGATAIIGGRIRKPDEFREVVRMVEQGRDRGLLKRAILSTWKEDEAESAALEIAYVRSLGWDVVLSDMSLVPPGPLFPGHIAYQKVALRAGLDLLADDAWVLKLRTDVCTANGPTFFQAMEDEIDLTIENRHFSDGIFRSKVMIDAALAFVPFICVDTVFFGRACDLSQISEMIPRRLYADADHAAEQLWFASPFITRSRDLSRAMTDFSWLPVAEKVRKGELPLADLFKTRPEITRYIALWLLVLDEWFSFRWPRAGGGRAITIEELFGAGRPIGGDPGFPGMHFGEASSAFINALCLVDFLDTPPRTEAGRRLAEEMEMIRQAGSLFALESVLPSSPPRRDASSQG